MVTIEKIQATVRAQGYQPRVISEEAAVVSPPTHGGPRSVPRHVDLASLPPQVAAAFRHAAALKRNVLLEFGGKG